MLDSSANQMWSCGGGDVKRTHAATADIKYSGPLSNNDCSHDERAITASHFLTHNCMTF